MVSAERGERGDAADGRDLHDVAAALGAHDRQYGLGDPERTEQVRLHLVAQLLFGNLLDHAEQAVARVVDDHLEAAELLVRGGHRCGDGRLVRDVERQGQNCVAVLGDEIIQCGLFLAVAATLSPRSRADSANARPRPRDVPVMNQTLPMMPPSEPTFRNRPPGQFLL